jgi:hypothetical protein
VCYVIHSLILRVVYSGVVTLFVCYAECPAICATSNPAFDQKMIEAVSTLQQSACC